MHGSATQHRKSPSLAPTTRSRLIDSLCLAVKSLSKILESCDNSPRGTEADFVSSQDAASAQVVPQAFRDAFACHLYMLFSVMFFMESEAKVATSQRGENKADNVETIAARATCADAMLKAAQSMGEHRSRLWQRGVPDEAVVGLPCRISYQMLESATGVVARKAASADAALGMIAATVDSAHSLLGTVVAALMDLLHSYEHIAPLVAELCTMVSENPSNRLAVELLREIGRLDTHSASSSDAGGKASGIKNLAPFISELAIVRPRIVLSNISLLLPHLNSEPYGLRSAIVSAIGRIVVNIGEDEGERNDEEDDNVEGTPGILGKESLQKSRAALLDILGERVHDMSSFTRVAVLKAWISITQSDSLPLERVMLVTALAIDRLQDKTVMVRRSAMQVSWHSTNTYFISRPSLTSFPFQLLTILLENNPFMGSLDPEPYRAKLQDIYAVLKSSMPADILEAQETAMKEAQEADDTDALRQIEKAALAAAIDEADSIVDSEDITPAEAEFRSNVKALKFAQSALDFIDQFEGANRVFQGMLLSANTSDVTEALRFFVRARHFKLPCAITGMKQALALMWSTEQAIRDEVLAAFVEVFIAVPGTDGKEPLPENQIAHNLLVLVGRATVSELASIEEALGRLVKDELIPADVFLILWSVASKASGDARAAALLILSMGGSADRGIVDSASRLRLLLDAGLGDYTEERRDWKTARAAACALQRVDRAKVDPSSAKYIVLEQIIERLCMIARGDWCFDGNTNDTLAWFSAAEQAIVALFVIAPEPEAACAEIIQGMASTTFGDDETSCHSLRLARFFFVLGHIALKLLVYTEAMSGAVRRANAAKSLKNQEMADKAKAEKRTRPNNNAEEEDPIEAELGMAAEIDAENERKMADIADKEILGRGLISKFGPLLIRVVGNEGGKFTSEILLQSATLALCKFMCISSSFCEDHLPLLFSALGNAPAQDTILRANTVIALGDHAFRFPNEVEPYTPRMYACLRDGSTTVRRHTLMVLTHLILNDMVKVKGQVCEIAMCLQDEDPRIRDMSRLLFHELSKRSNNPVYNLLPDIISQLSQQSLRKEEFRSIMSFLLAFIKKERQNEMLVEKLCHRFPNCQTISQKADLAFCIAQLKMSDRAIKCLCDLFKLYKDALFDDDVKKCFFSIVTKTKKFAKPETKECLEEWEAKLNEHAMIGEENQRAGQKAVRAKARAAKRATRKKRLEEEVDQEEESHTSDGDDYENKENHRSRSSSARKTPSRRQPRRQLNAESPNLGN